MIGMTENLLYTYDEATLARCKKYGDVAVDIAFDYDFRANGADFYLLVEEHHTQADIDAAKRFLRRNRDVASIEIARPRYAK